MGYVERAKERKDDPHFCWSLRMGERQLCASASRHGGDAGEIPKGEMTPRRTFLESQDSATVPVQGFVFLW